ncbi:MAG: hypothetical protein ACRCX2_11080 [Paraclostridium sp.]
MSDKKVYNFESPKYPKGKIKFTSFSGGESTEIEFIAGPSAMQEQRSNSVQIDKTMSGWFLSRSGPGIGNLNISGFLLDCKEAGERFEFLKKYKDGAEDVLSSYFEYSNKFKQSIEIEGIEYYGFIQSMTIGKAQSTPYAYNFSVSFAFVADKQTFSPSESVSGGRDSSSSRYNTYSTSKSRNYEFNSINNMVARSSNTVNETNSKQTVKALSSSSRITKSSSNSKLMMSSATLKILTNERGVD